MNDMTTIDEPVETFRPSAAIDPVRLDYLWTLAERIASSSLVPESLRTIGSGNNKTDLPREQVVANVFAVVEQADRWNISPFALLACAAIVHGRLGFEGKVISAVLKSRYGIDLEYEWFGTGEEMSIKITGRKPGSDKLLTIDGSVKEWKTSGNGSPWRPATYAKMMVYRGAREWSRVYEPSAIMGVLGDDEILAIGMERQAQLARDVTPSLADRFGGRQSAEGFNADNVKQLTSSGQVAMETIDQKTGEILKTEVQRETTVNKSTSSAKAASAKPASDDAGRSGEHSSGSDDSRSTNSSQDSAERGQDDAGGKTEAATKRLPAELFKKYASALARMQTEGNVDKASAQFWQENGGAPKGGVDRALAKSIYDKQMARAKGDLNAEGLLDEINANIDTSFAGDGL
ncbi:hypothetical protein [Mesorhizobium sp.]|uniref:hypothetical protein n=1 Tax=Mesorhizobium sp. TaxID=1871066 RepID=UPI00121ADE73|nr:hypothetical protein [Mesorhizobium sp.]TIX28800.1 MAG: hypothetical protein E5V35_00125 [Mesorhizobium sp.]